MTTYCFCGPTITYDEVARIAPGIECLPPIGHGDLLKLPVASGDVIAIIDGFYFQEYPVRHKEILDAMDRGATVIGASSMGALRAAELAPYGMIGVGLIYQMYQSQTLTADDEVAVVHGDAAAGYLGTTEALINVRATLRRARRLHILDEAGELNILTSASQLPFYERTYPYILDIAERNGLDRTVRVDFAAQLESMRVDLKRRDALYLIRNLEELTRHAGRQITPVPQTTFLVEWRHKFTPHPGPVDSKVLNFVRVFAADFPAVYFEGFAKWCVANSPTTREGVKTPATVLAEEFAALWGIQDVEHWLGQRGLRTAEFHRYLGIEARSRTVVGDEISPTEDTYRDAIIDYGYRLGIIDDAAAVPAHLTKWLTDAEVGLISVEKWARIVARTTRLERTLAFHDYVMAIIRVSEPFPKLVEILHGVTELNRALLERRSDHRLQHVAGSTVIAWLQELWQSEGPFERSLAVRGFSTEQAAVRASREFLFYAKTQTLELEPLLTLQASPAV